MGDTTSYQPLTSEDRITVLLYRAGIVSSSLVVVLSAILAVMAGQSPALLEIPLIGSGLAANILLLLLYFSTGLSVFFIHLYIGKFHRLLKKIYYGAVVCLIALFIMGHGSPAAALFKPVPVGALLLIPVACCLGFITAKEAFCFQLLEGYLLGMIMPAYLFLYGVGLLSGLRALYGLALIAGLLVLFMIRKVFQPLHYDIGDKSAYQP